MTLKVKVPGSNTDQVHVPGLGSFVPGEWTEITEEQAARFESVHGRSLKEAPGFEVKTETPKKKEEDK